MRQLQGIMGRWMAVNLLKTRVYDLNTEVPRNLDAMESAPGDEDKEAVLKCLKKKYYTIAIYDVVWPDIFGYSPVYMVAPGSSMYWMKRDSSTSSGSGPDQGAPVSIARTQSQ